MAAASRNNISGSPIYDVTPMLQPDSAVSVNVDSLEHTEPMSASFDPTPVWQDTPSQSVDGTEEVTQERNVQAQLEKYAEEYGARVAAHQKELKAFYERNPSRLKKNQDTAPSCDLGLAEELRAPTVIQLEKTLDVAKRKVSALPTEKLATVGTPRRSTRVVANTRMNITNRESSSPKKSRSAKRARVVDKVYALDVADDGDAGDFEDVADKIKSRKRQIDGDVPNSSILKNTHGVKKPRAMNKPQGQNKKSDTANVHPKRKFQQTVRCSLGEVLEAVKLLKDRHIVKVRLAGFGCVFDWVLEGNVSRILMCYLMMKIDTSTMKIHCGSGRVLEVNREAVHQVFGFPMGGDTAPRPADSGHDESLSILKKELGFEKNDSIETKDLRSLLASLVNVPGKDDLVVKVFFAILYNKLICPGLAVRLGREAAMLVNMDYKKMSKMDFCQLVVDEIKRAAEKYQDQTIKQSGPEGCGVVPVVMYLDSCYSAKCSLMHTKTPRANYLHEKPLRDIFYKDMMFHGGSDILNYKFGNVAWKGRNDIAYSYRLSEEELRLKPILSSPTQSSSLNSDHVPLASSQHELLLSQDHVAIYDVMPLLHPDGAAALSVDSLERTGGPLFYSTPLQVVYDGNNVTEPMSAAFEATPVWQDTPSQSVDGTEEVTQEHNVAQLEKYAEEYGARGAAHQKERAPSAIQKKKRLDVARRKVSAVSPEKLATVGTPRRSPRVLANIRMDITDQDSTSPEKSRSAKHARVVDKTYAPDVADDGALDDDASDFEDAADKIKRRKRQLDGDVPSCSSLNNTHGGKKPRAMNKPQGHNKKSDAANIHPNRKFQQTVRCSLGEVLEAVKLLKDRHIVKVRLAGFGCVFDWVLEGNISRILMCYLMMKMDTSTMKIQCGSGRVLEVNREAVHQVFGFPMGGDTAPRPADSGHDESLYILKKELGFEKHGSIETKDLRSLLASLVNDPGKDDLAVKVFFAILYNKLICPGLTVRLGREAAMLVNMDYEKMSKMDFCQLVVDEIKRAAEKYQDQTIKQSGPEGCGVVPVVMYLDSCYSAKYSVMHTKTPRVNYLHEKPLRDIFYMDMMFHGGSDILNYKFGNVTWKGRNDIAYSYRLPEEELRLEPILSSPTQSSSLNYDHVPLPASQRELLVSHQKLHLKNMVAGSKGEERPSSESLMIDSLKRRNTELEAELAAALKLASENLDKAVESREQVMKAEDIGMNMFEELKKMMASNVDLTKKVLDVLGSSPAPAKSGQNN